MEMARSASHWCWNTLSILCSKNKNKLILHHSKLGGWTRFQLFGFGSVAVSRTPTWSIWMVRRDAVTPPDVIHARNVTDLWQTDHRVTYYGIKLQPVSPGFFTAYANRTLIAPNGPINETRETMRIVNHGLITHRKNIQTCLKINQTSGVFNVNPGSRIPSWFIINS